MDLVEKHQRCPLLAPAAQEPFVVAPVAVDGSELRVEDTGQAGRGESEAEILIGVVVQREGGRAHADPEAIGAPKGDVPTPEAVEDVELAPVDRLAVGVVFLAIEQGAGMRTAGTVVAQGRCFDRHRPEHHDPAAAGVPAGVPGDQVAPEVDIVIGEQDDLGGGAPHADVEGGGLAPVLARDDDQAWLGPGQAGAAVEGVLVGPIEDDHELGGGGVGKGGVDEAGK